VDHLTLDHDVAPKLKTELQRSGPPFREIVDEHCVRGWKADAQSPSGGPSR